MADTEYTPDDPVWNNPVVDQVGLSPTVDAAATAAATAAENANIMYKGAVMQSSPEGYANGDGETFVPSEINGGEPGLDVVLPAGFTPEPQNEEAAPNPGDTPEPTTLES